MTLTESNFPHQDVEQLSSTQQKLEQSWDQGTYMHGTAAQPKNTTERGNSTYHEQVDTAHL